MSREPQFSDAQWERIAPLMPHRHEDARGHRPGQAGHRGDQAEQREVACRRALPVRPGEEPAPWAEHSMSREPLIIGMRVHVVDHLLSATRPHVSDRSLLLRIGLEIVSGEVTINAVEQ